MSNYHSWDTSSAVTFTITVQPTIICGYWCSRRRVGNHGPSRCAKNSGWPPVITICTWSGLRTTTAVRSDGGCEIAQQRQRRQANPVAVCHHGVTCAPLANADLLLLRQQHVDDAGGFEPRVCVNYFCCNCIQGCQQLAHAGAAMLQCWNDRDCDASASSSCSLRTSDVTLH